MEESRLKRINEGSTSITGKVEGTDFDFEGSNSDLKLFLAQKYIEGKNPVYRMPISVIMNFVLEMYLTLRDELGHDKEFFTMLDCLEIIYRDNIKLREKKND